MEQKYSGENPEWGQQPGDSHPPHVLQETGKRSQSWEGEGLDWGEHLRSCSLGNGIGFHPSRAARAFPGGFAGRSQLLLDGNGGKTGFSRLEEYPRCLRAQGCIPWVKEPPAPILGFLIPFPSSSANSPHGFGSRPWETRPFPAKALSDEKKLPDPLPMGEVGEPLGHGKVSFPTSWREGRGHKNPRHIPGWELRRGEAR